MSSLRQKLIKKFRDRKFRQVYVDSFLDTYVSTQIRALREDRKLSQKQLAKMIGTTQPGVSAFESTDYSSWSIRTLRKLAAAFDLALIVRFESFGSVLNDITTYSRQRLGRPSFDEDPIFRQEETSPRDTAVSFPGGLVLQGSVTASPLIAGATTGDQWRAYRAGTLSPVSLMDNMVLYSMPALEIGDINVYSGQGTEGNRRPSIGAYPVWTSFG